MDALGRVAGGGTALDPAVIAKLLGRAGGMGKARADPLASLTDRERSVLALMAEGLSSTAIAGRLFLSEGAIGKYTTTIFAKLGLAAAAAAADDDDTNRRVRAVLAVTGRPQQVPVRAGRVAVAGGSGAFLLVDCAAAGKRSGSGQ
jgi:DNA-binding NarL/FixJ family response regulator